MKEDESNQAKWIAIILGTLILLGVIVFGGIHQQWVYLLVTSIAFFLILIGIFWHYRRKISGVIIVILLLFLTFFITGFIASALHLSSYPFNLGVVTLIFLMAYAFWVNPQNISTEWWKFPIFAGLLVIFYSTGLLPSLNSTADALLKFAGNTI